GSGAVYLQRLRRRTARPRSILGSAVRTSGAARAPPARVALGSAQCAALPTARPANGGGLRGRARAKRPHQRRLCLASSRPATSHSKALPVAGTLGHAGGSTRRRWSRDLAAKSRISAAA